MQSFKSFISEEVTQQQINALEKALDKLFAAVNVDIDFSRHFVDRVNDARNGKPITFGELQTLFRKTFIKYKDTIANHQPNWEAVLKDISTQINVPFVLKWDNRNKELDLVAKTIMRKKNFMTPNATLKV